MTNLSRQELQEKIFLSLRNVLGKKAKDISLEQKLVEDLGLDSFAALELIYDIEDSLKIKVPDEDAKKFVFVKDVLEYVSQKLLLNQGGV